MPHTRSAPAAAPPVPSVVAAGTVSPGLFSWWHAADATAHRALVAASFGWMLDAFDVMLYSMVLASLIGDMGLSKTQAGMLGSLTLLAQSG